MTALLRHPLLGLPLVLAFPAASAPAGAQSAWVGQGPQPSISLELLRPSFEGDPDISAASFVSYTTAAIPISRRLKVVLEVPFARLAIEEPFLSFTSNEVGNPYLGVTLGSPGRGSSIELGVRPPVVDEGDDDDLGAVAYALITDLDRLEAWIPDALSLSALGNFGWRATSGLFGRVRAGGAAIVPTEDGDTEVFLNYGAHGGFETGPVVVAAAFTGRWVVTEDEGFDENSVHSLTFSLGLARGSLRPALHFRVPMDQPTDFIEVKHVLGISLEFRGR